MALAIFPVYSSRKMTYFIRYPNHLYLKCDNELHSLKPTPIVHTRRIIEQGLLLRISIQRQGSRCQVDYLLLMSISSVPIAAHSQLAQKNIGRKRTKNI